MGITSNGDIDIFFKNLDGVIDLVIEQLIERFEIQARKKVKNYPFLMDKVYGLIQTSLGRKMKLGSVKARNLVYGFRIGECLALTGYHHGESENLKARP